MSEDDVLTRIRKSFSPPKKNNFQSLGSTSMIELTATPAPALLPDVTHKAAEIAIVTSNKTTKSNRRPSQSSRRPSLTNRRLSQSTPKPKPTPKSKSKPKSKPPPAIVSPSVIGPGCSFELTPLSGLIKQSFTDISLLRRLHDIQSPAYPSPAYSPPTKSSANSPRGNGPTSPQVRQTLIDFDKVEENLRKFEELYRQFLNYGGRFGEKAEEVHLVAVVCKRSDVVKGQMGVVDGSVPRVKRVWVDCGF